MGRSAHTSDSRTQAGRAVALALAGSWRSPPPPLVLGRDLTQTELAIAAPLAIHGGAGALVSRRLLAASAEGPVARELRQLHRRQALEEAMQREWLVRLSGALADARVPFTLIKGFTIAARYPEAGLRPFCDLDVVVAPSDVAAVRQIKLALPQLELDVHTMVPHLAPAWAAEALARATEERFAGSVVRVLRHEDALALLALHALAHGVWRPVWLCDLAVFVEGAARTLDWDRVLGGPMRQSQGVATALLLAREALGARLDGTPLAERRTPSWLLPALHAQWGATYEVQAPQVGMPRTPAALMEVARRRFRDPITATAAVGPWNELPRWPFQMIDLAQRSARFVRRQLRRPS